MIRYSQSNSDGLQESFVLSMLQEKLGGYYVEVGSGRPFNGNNTFILESMFKWIGVGLDLNDKNVLEYNKNRKNPSIATDAITFNYSEYFKNNNFPKQIDFLQIDIDSSGLETKYSGNGNLLALMNIPLIEYRFSVIIFEHECIQNYKNKPIRDAQREMLSALDYVLLGSTGLEDWWVDPKVISREVYKTEYFLSIYPHVDKTISNINIGGTSNEK
jgi:hypothetical protein